MIRARYAPGTAIVAIAGKVVVLPPDVPDDVVDEIWPLLRGDVDALLAALDGVDDVAVVSGDRTSARIVIRGALSATVTGDEIDDVTLSGAPADSDAAEHVVQGAERVELSLAWRAAEPVLPIVAGIVRASAVRIALPLAPERVEEAVQTGETHILPHETILPIDADGDGIYDDHESHAAPRSAQPPTAPTELSRVPAVDGVTGDHDGNTVLPKDVLSARAATPAAPAAPAAPAVPAAPAGEGDHDGRTISGQDLSALRAGAAVPAARSTTARVRVSNGTEAPLDRPVLIGRRPRSVRSVGDDVPYLVTVESPMHDISRNHIEIKIEDDSAIVTDLNSTNGTMLYRDGDPQRLHPGERTILIDGDTLDLGEGVIVSFEGLP
ncbi:MAG: FHA domain-containing protein [Microbacterium sp.]